MSIWAEVLRFIEGPDPALFEGLALRVFRHQFDSIEPYRAYCIGKGLRPAKIASIDEIPPISTVAFKHAELSQGRAQRVFLTSGTTIGAQKRGRHFIPDLRVYRAAAVRHLERMLFPDRPVIRMLALHPTADLMPESSLAQMVSWASKEFGTAGRCCAASPVSVDIPATRAFMLDCVCTREPVCILGTTAALAALFSSLSEDQAAISLPSGSRLMDTGGAKGQATPLDRREVLAKAEGLLGIPGPLVINEYGMTEMCSQLYDLTDFNWRDEDGSGRLRPPPLGGLRPKLGPPWLRAVARDPVTLAPVPDGEPGLLSFFDLANVGSVSALVTEDLGIVDRGAAYVIGRGVGEARGCALGIAEFAKAEERRRLRTGGGE